MGESGFATDMVRDHGVVHVHFFICSLFVSRDERSLVFLVLAGNKLRLWSGRFGGVGTSPLREPAPLSLW